jgi:hypothetical protein
MANETPLHRWRFHRVGGLDQVDITTAEDLRHLRELDQKLWVALSCPVTGIELDQRTLELIDLDHDGRVRAPEVLAAIAFCEARLTGLGALLPGEAALPLTAISDSTAEGRATAAAARRVLAALGKADAGQLKPEDVKDLGRFLDAARTEAVAAWVDEGRAGGALVLGEATEAAWAAVEAVRLKVDDYFVRCRMAAIDPRGAALLNRSVEELMLLASGQLSAASATLAGFPIARVEPERPLPLRVGINPAWAGPVEALRAAVVAAHGEGQEALTEAGWLALQARLAPCKDWIASKPGTAAASPGAAGAAYQAEAAALKDLAKLVHCHRDMALLLRNFVNFDDFYHPGKAAIFQAGTLYLDGRSCDLCVRVADPAAHAPLAMGSNMFIAYCELKRAGGETMKIAACFTQGDSDFLAVGRHGVFYDRQGRDWDATVVRLVDHPIALRQAFAAPYKKFIKLVEQQTARFAAAREKEGDARLAAAAALHLPGPPQPPPAVDVGKMVGIIAALGVGVGALATILGGFVSGFIGLQPWWAKLVAVGGVVLIVSGPSMLIAWLKLRQRTLGPLLDATGWAINGRIRVNLPIGTALTDVARLPPGARRSLEDPFEDVGARQRRRVLMLVVALLMAALAAARYQHLWPFPAAGGP